MLKSTPEEKNENEVIKLTQVPLRFLNENTNYRTRNSNERTSENKDLNAIKLDHLSTTPLSTKSKDTGKAKAETKNKSSEDINKKTLKNLQERLTNIISKLEERVRKKKGKLKQEEKDESLSKIAKSKPSEKSLTFLKKRLSRVMKKFNSKSGPGQPFTIGKEWHNVFNENTPNRGNELKAVEKKKTKNKESEGSLELCIFQHTRTIIARLN